jgi:hypothetical protein
MTAAAGNNGIRRTASNSRETSYLQQRRQECQGLWQKQELATKSCNICNSKDTSNSRYANNIKNIRRDANSCRDARNIIDANNSGVFEDIRKKVRTAKNVWKKKKKNALFFVRYISVS